jgi:hypothetical protein
MRRRHRRIVRGVAWTLGLMLGCAVSGWMLIHMLDQVALSR